MTGPTRTRRCCPANATTLICERCRRVGADALRQGLAAPDRQVAAGMVGTADPARASPLLRLVAVWRGMDIKALQELLGHQWLATTSGYIHVRDDHIEQAWTDANRRLETRFAEGG